MKTIAYMAIGAVFFLTLACGKNQITITDLDTYEPVEERIYGTTEDDVIQGKNVFGDYGNDVLTGTDSDDVLNGGHGEDVLDGGDGDDLIISRSDGREARLNQNYKPYRDPDEEMDTETKTLKGSYPIKGNDMLIGGAGADIFRFISHMNAKERIIEEHTMESGMIHWHDIAKENRLLHDHWVERMGNDTIKDFNVAEGDMIELIGHTLHIRELVYTDVDNDGTEESIIYLQSKQAPGGAHHKDQLGSIIVFGDRLEKEQYIRDPLPAIGVIEHIDDLEEALAPLKGEEELGW